MIDIDALLAANDGILLARNHRRLKSSLSRWTQKGYLVRIMRGAYAHPRHGLAQKTMSVTRLISGAVISGHTALAITLPGWPAPEVIEICAPGRHMPQKGFSFTQRTIPAAYQHRHVMSPILAAVDLADQTCDPLDQLMREHKIDPAHFQTALATFPRRRGNRQRRKQVKRSQTRPWSKAEREYHDLFDKHHLKGWTANRTIQIGDHYATPDAAWHKEKLLVEIDGYATHSDRAAFENDRQRQNQLTQAGWTILRFTWNMLDQPDMVINTIKTTLTRLRRRQR